MDNNTTSQIVLSLSQKQVITTKQRTCLALFTEYGRGQIFPREDALIVHIQRTETYDAEKIRINHFTVTGLSNS